MDEAKQSVEKGSVGDSGAMTVTLINNGEQTVYVRTSPADKGDWDSFDGVNGVGIPSQGGKVQILGASMGYTTSVAAWALEVAYDQEFEQNLMQQVVSTSLPAAPYTAQTQVIRTNGLPISMSTLGVPVGEDGAKAAQIGATYPFTVTVL
jgi:hypothetical protein